MGAKGYGGYGGGWDQDWSSSTYGKVGTTTNLGSKSGGFHTGGCGHLGKIEVWRFDGRAFYGAGSAIKVGDNVRAVIDLAGTATGEIRKNQGDRPPEPPTKQDVVGQLKFMVQPTPGWFYTAIHTELEARQLEIEQDYLKALKTYEEEVLPAWKAQNTKPEGPVHIRLDWADMSAPKVGASFWRALWKTLPQGTDTDPAIIQVCCMGGHGRTGTCLAALMIACGGQSWKNAINHVRYYHCASAIETDGQVDYLRQLSIVVGTAAIKTDVELADKLDGVVAAKEQGSGVASSKGGKTNGKDVKGKATSSSATLPLPTVLASAAAQSWWPKVGPTAASTPLPAVSTSQEEFFKQACSPSSARLPLQVLVSDQEGRLFWADYLVWRAMDNKHYMVRGINFGDQLS